MSTLEDAARLIHEAVLHVNRELPEDSRLGASGETPLIGPKANLDSLALVSLIAFLEGQLSQRTGRAVALVDESGLDPERSPFRNLSTLTEHVARLLA